VNLHNVASAALPHGLQIVALPPDSGEATAVASVASNIAGPAWRWAASSSTRQPGRLRPVPTRSSARCHGPSASIGATSTPDLEGHPGLRHGRSHEQRLGSISPDAGDV